MEDQGIPRLLSVREVSEQIGIPRWRLYELVRLGAFPAVRVGKAIRFSAPAIREWIEGGGTKEDGG